MAPVSAILHAMGICMRRYLDDWLVQSSSRESLLRDLQTVLDLCRELGVVVNLEKSNLVPSQVVQYLGVVINTQSFAASPSPDRVSRLLSTAEEFQSSVGWGAHLGPHVASGLWNLDQASLSINARELLAIQHGLLHFQLSLRGRTVAVFCDNVTAVAYLRKEGGTRSPLLNSIAQEILRWSESLAIRLAPQFIPGSNNVLADALSRPHQLPHSEWSLNMTVFRSLCRLWPVQIDLFATSANHRCSIYFSPYRDPQSAGTDAFLQSWDGLQAYAFPPFAIIPRVLAKLRESRGTELTLVAPHWAQRPWFPDLLQLSLAPLVVLSDRPDLLRLPQSRLLYPGLHRLRLHAWRLSSGLPGLQASPLL